MTLVLQPVLVRRLCPTIGPLVVLAGLAILGPLLAPQDPTTQDLLRVMEAPSVRHWLGTDHVGRDICPASWPGLPIRSGSPSCAWHWRPAWASRWASSRPMVAR